MNGSPLKSLRQKSDMIMFMFDDHFDDERHEWKEEHR